LCPHSGYQPIEFGAVDVNRQMLAAEIGDVSEHFSARPGKVKGSARPEQRRLGSGPIGVEHRLGRQAESPLRRIAAQARLPEGSGPTRGMAAANVLRFDQHHA
jgi:hypothetical protein